MIKRLWIIVFLFASIALFFYPIFLKGYIPFPGDLLVAEYKPWRSYSYLGYNPGSVPNKAQYPDTIRQLYPWKTLVVDSFKKFQLPLWNPYNFSGSPLLANFQSAALYPFNAIYMMLSMPIAWTILVILQPLLATWFTYLYSKKIGLSRLAASFAGVTYGFSSFMTVWLEYNTIGHVILWLPLLLLALEYIREKHSARWSTIFLFASVSTIFAGHPQIAGYLLVFVGIYGLIRANMTNGRVCIGFLYLLAIGIGAIQLIPGLELIAQSARSPHTFTTLFEKILIQPWQLIMAVIPDFFGNPATRNYWPADTYIGKVLYVGLAPFLFFPSALRKKDKVFVKIFGVTAVAVLLLASANPVTYLLYKLPLPLLSTSAPTLMIFLYCFSAAILAGLGLDSWMQGGHSKKKLVRRIMQALGFFLLLLIATFLLPKIFHQDWAAHIVVAKRPIILSMMIMSSLFIPFAIAILKPKHMHIAIILLIAMHVFDLFLFFKKFTPFSPVDFIYPKTNILSFLKEKDGIDRFWGHSSAYIEANANAVDKLYSTEGYDPLYPKWYGEFIQSSRDGKIQQTFTDQTRSDATIAPSTGNEDIGGNIYRLKVLDSLGISYILDRDENASSQVGFPPSRYQLAYQADAWKIYLNRKAAPRYILTSDYKQYNTPSSFSTLFFNPSFNPAKQILLEEYPGFASAVPDSQGTTTLQTYSANEVRIITHSKQTNLLFLSDTYYPGWEAFIDAKSTRIFKANWAFRAVVVPSGEHIVRFVYQPKSFTIGAIVSGITVLVTVLFFALQKRKRT